MKMKITDFTSISKLKEMGCPHLDKKHYAKNMCNACYHRQGRVKKAWLCPHTNKVHYARGKCRNCYLNSYHKVTLKFFYVLFFLRNIEVEKNKPQKMKQ
jgi:hypothetical protein